MKNLEAKSRRQLSQSAHQMCTGQSRDARPIYSRILGLQKGPEIIFKEIIEHELAHIPSSMFKENVDMKITKSKIKEETSIRDTSSNIFYHVILDKSCTDLP